MVLPEPPLAPVIPPVTVPIVHTNVLGAVAVKPIAVDVPLQILAVFVVVTIGMGLMVIATGPPLVKAELRKQLFASVTDTNV